MKVHVFLEKKLNNIKVQSVHIIDSVFILENLWITKGE